jgi:hypothetical protein
MSPIRARFATFVLPFRWSEYFSEPTGVGGPQSLQRLGTPPAGGHTQISAEFRNFFFITDRPRGLRKNVAKFRVGGR